jgi:hypothetical protein
VVVRVVVGTVGTHCRCPSIDNRRLERAILNRSSRFFQAEFRGR